jgi:hypothetical protein
MAITRSQQAKQLLALGGRIGLQEGGIMPRLNQLGSGVSSAEQTLQEINQRLESAESSLGEGGGTEVVQASGTLNGKPLFPEGTTFPSGGMKLPVFTGTPQQIDPPSFARPGNIPGTDVPFSNLRSGIPAAGYADGGMLVKPGFGGTRQGYRGEGGYQGGRSDTPPGAAPAGGVDRSKTTAAQDANQRAQVRAGNVRAVENLIGRPTFGLTGAGKFNFFAGPPRGFNPPTRDGAGRDQMPLWMQLGYSSEAEYNRAMGGGIMSPGAMQSQGLDLNRIAYRFMADGGFLEDTDEARQAYGLGSIVKKAFKTVRKPFKAVTKTLKKVAKSPTGKLLLAVAAPYALGPAKAQASFLQGLTAAQQAALISGATTGITQLATGQDLDFKDIALSAAIGGVSASAFPPGGAKPGVDRQAFNASRTSAGKFQMPRGGGADFSNVAISAPTQTSRLSGIQDYGSAINVTSPVQTSTSTAISSTLPTSRDFAKIPSARTPDANIFTKIKEGLGNIKDSKLTDILLRNDEGKLSPLKLASLAGLAGLATAKGFEEQTPEEQDRGESIDFAAIRRRPFDTLAPRFGGSQFDFYAAEGGQAKKEPVAKKVMPLLDMGGMEKDYRAEGGFVPIGRMEKADDVPARLSKNEFVFTADAVRNAGDGDVDKGAEVMYNMMKNLEAGGDVSEESQGLEGARRMFQTSQRLEEVL